MRIVEILLSLIFCIVVSAMSANAHPIEKKFKKFENGEHCQEIVRKDNKILLCIKSVKLSNSSILGYGEPLYCAGKLKVSKEGIVTGVSTKRAIGHKNLLRHCLKSMRLFKFYPPINQSGDSVALKKVIMSMNYREKKYAIPLITPYNVSIKFGQSKDYKKEPLAGFSTLIFAVISPDTIIQ